MEKTTLNGMKQGQEDSFPTNPDLVDILGEPDLDFENLYASYLFGSHIPRFLDVQMNILPCREHFAVKHLP